ncbi:MAG: hypothetical protein U0166_12620 [Acidobacteriota bacterium]
MVQPSRSAVRWLKRALQAVLIVGSAEIAAYGVARVRLHESYATIPVSKQEVLRTVPQEAPSSVDESAPLPLNIRRALHPYFGFVYESATGRQIVNNQGFLEAVDYPYQPSAGELVIGIFGGSVALDLRSREARDAIEAPLLAASRQKGYDEVTILMFAQSAWREPQSIYCFLYEMESIDAAIFLEGYNEIGQLPLRDEPHARAYPWSFPAPQMYERLVGRTRSAADMKREVEIGTLRERQLRWTRGSSWGPLGRSMLVHLVWRYEIQSLERRIERIQSQMDPATSATIRNVFPPGATFEQVTRDYFDRYERWIEVAHRAGEVARKPAFFFLQPNQHLTGSKPMGDEERTVSLGRPEAGGVVDAYYPVLRSTFARLAGRGVAAFDLSMIFEGTTERVYTDSCCHMNPTGMTKIAGEIGREVAASPLLGTIPNASERRLPFGARPADSPPAAASSPTVAPRVAHPLQVGSPRK